MKSPSWSRYQFPYQCSAAPPVPQPMPNLIPPVRSPSPTIGAPPQRSRRAQIWEADHVRQGPLGTGLEREDVEARGRELGRDRAAGHAGADHHRFDRFV